MCEKEKMYIEKFGTEFLSLKPACSIWKKPGYATLSKILPKIGYTVAVDRKIIPKYKKVGSSYLFRIKDILDFLDDTEVQDEE